MTTSASPTVGSDSSRQSGVKGCIFTVLAILFAFLGIYNLVFDTVIAYVFFSAQILSKANLAIVFIIAVDCFIYFFLAFRLRRQHWLVTLGVLAFIWFVSLPLHSMINSTTMRLRNDGYSMGNTMASGSYVVADRLAYQQDDPQRGDIVVFQLPSSESTLLIKRIIRLPGDVVSVGGGQVSINGTLVNEPYLAEEPAYSGEWKIPEGQYFVLGDNRNESKDSHQWGTLPRENILAKVVWIYFPFSDFGKIAEVNYAQ